MCQTQTLVTGRTFGPRSHATCTEDKQGWSGLVGGEAEIKDGGDGTGDGGRRSRLIPFLLAAVSVCDIQAFTENRFAKRGQTENRETDRKITSGGEGEGPTCSRNRSRK